MSVKVKFKKLHEAAIIPEYKSSGAAGFDFCAVVEDQSKVIKHKSSIEVTNSAFLIPPMGQRIVKTGLSVEIPKGYELQVRPRSGLAFNDSITITNSPGIIDSDYRGEIMIILFNLGENPFIIKTGDRIAQGVVSAIPNVEIEEVAALSDTERGQGGFGSTGI